MNCPTTTLDNLRSHIALVSQDVVLFNDTVAGNIAYGALAGASREAIEQAASDAHAMGFIEQLPEGHGHPGRRKRHTAVRRATPAPRHRPGPVERCARS